MVWASVNSRPRLKFNSGTIIFHHSPHGQSIYLYVNCTIFMETSQSCLKIFHENQGVLWLAKKKKKVGPLMAPYPQTLGTNVAWGGHSNTSVVHMPDQRFSKHTLNTISPRKEKHPLNENFARFCPEIYP